MSALEQIVAKIPSAQKTGPSSYKCKCTNPSHKDDNPSMTLTETSNGTVLVYCHGCKESPDILLSGIGLPYSALYEDYWFEDRTWKGCDENEDNRQSKYLESLKNGETLFTKPPKSPADRFTAEQAKQFLDVFRNFLDENSEYRKTITTHPNGLWNLINVSWFDKERK